jgi:hypothetical protein
MAKKENIEIALGAICYIGLVIYAVVVKKYAALIVLGIILLFIVGLMIWANLSIRGIKKTNKKINDKYHILKEKTERTVFEECYVLSIKE